MPVWHNELFTLDDPIDGTHVAHRNIPVGRPLDIRIARLQVGPTVVSGQRNWGRWVAFPK